MKRLPLFVGFVAASLIVAFKPGLQLLLFAWHTDDQSYILVVPAMAIVLVFWDRKRIFESVSADIDLRAAYGFAISTVLIAVAYWLPNGTEPQLASAAIGLVTFWAAAFTLCFGVTAGSAAIFPLGMLACITPIPAAWIDAVTVALQRGSADTVDWLFHATSVPYLRDGFTFQLAGQGIVVARECSGIRSSLSLIVLTLVIAHEALRTIPRRLILIASTLPIVVLKNGVRIVTLTLLAIYVDPSFLNGSLHHDGGIVFFLIGLLMLTPVLTLLRRSELHKPKLLPQEIARSAKGTHA